MSSSWPKCRGPARGAPRAGSTDAAHGATPLVVMYVDEPRVFWENGSSRRGVLWAPGETGQILVSGRRRASTAYT